MIGDVLILTGDEGDESSRRLVSLVEFMGLTPEQRILSSVVQNSALEPDGFSSVLISADSLIIYSDLDVCNSDVPVLVYGFRDCDEHAALVSKLSGGGLSGVISAIDESEYHVAPSSGDRGTGHFSGLKFGPTNPLLDSTFSLEPERGPQPNILVSVGDGALFVECKPHSERGAVYLLGVAGVADVGRLTDRMPRVSSLFSSLVCFMMFVKKSCEDESLTPINPGSCVIIDDPLLRPKYGFVNYEKLLKDMEQHNYAVSISHVPKNSGKTSSSTAKLFADNTDRFSVCVHGCDHIRGELSSTNKVVLNELVTTSLGLMAKHEVEHGVAWDNVMVFPHGLFSVEAARVLSNYGLLAGAFSVDAIDCGSNPRGEHEEVYHPLVSFLMPVVTVYGGLPMLLRRYPRSLEEFAFDLFLGRPLIITTHHQNFRRGAKELNAFIDQLNEMEPNLKWTGLAEIVKSCIVCDSIDVNVSDIENVVELPAGTNSRLVLYAVRRWLMIIRDNLLAKVCGE